MKVALSSASCSLCVQRKIPPPSFSRRLVSLGLWHFSQTHLCNCCFSAPFLTVLLECQQTARCGLPAFPCSVQALPVIWPTVSPALLSAGDSWFHMSSSVLSADFQTHSLNRLWDRMHCFFIHTSGVTYTELNGFTTYASLWVAHVVSQLSTC